MESSIIEVAVASESQWRVFFSTAVVRTGRPRIGARASSFWVDFDLKGRPYCRDLVMEEAAASSDTSANEDENADWNALVELEKRESAESRFDERNDGTISSALNLGSCGTSMLD